MKESFVSEAIKPIGESFETGQMAAGEPGLPRQFIWRDKTYTVTSVLKKWKKLSPCTHGSGELYVNKHFYEVETDQNKRMKIYFERKVHRGKKALSPRWWILSVSAS